MSSLRFLWALTFALWLSAWAVYAYSWHWAMPRHRARWILASAVCSVLGSVATGALFIWMLLSW